MLNRYYDNIFYWISCNILWLILKLYDLYLKKIGWNYWGNFIYLFVFDCFVFGLKNGGYGFWIISCIFVFGMNDR